MGGIFAPGPTKFTTTTSYDGTNWTTESAMPEAKVGSSATGTTAEAIVWSGQGPGPSLVTSTFKYDGTNWSTDAAIGTARKTLNTRAGTSTSAVTVAGAAAPGDVNNTEEYNFAATTKTFTTS